MQSSVRCGLSGFRRRQFCLQKSRKGSERLEVLGASAAPRRRRTVELGPGAELMGPQAAQTALRQPQGHSPRERSSSRPAELPRHCDARPKSIRNPMDSTPNLLTGLQDTSPSQLFIARRWEHLIHHRKPTTAPSKLMKNYLRR